MNFLLTRALDFLLTLALVFLLTPATEHSALLMSTKKPLFAAASA
ncbi:MAG: hypothetical protein Q4G54_01860 [Pelistega sp.]|nr:hypothetical protein [Pelistega sp.]